MEIKVPELSLVLLIGVSGSGKSSFARKHFLPTEVISSDACRAAVSDDENDQSATDDAFELLHFMVGKRLKRGMLTVVDATNVQREGRKSLVELARKWHVIPVAIVLDLPEELCQDRNAARTDRNFGEHVVRKQRQQLRKSLRGLKDEGFRHIAVLKSPEEVDAVTGIFRDRLYNNLKHETGPFDIIGDIHGCFHELVELLEKLGYSVASVPDDGRNHGFSVTAPAGRKAVFLGDLVDRGPDSPGVLRLVMHMVQAGIALCVPGNHDVKLHKWLSGKQVQLKHGLDLTVAQLAEVPGGFKRGVSQFLDGLVSHYVLDGGRMVVAHAGMREDMQGRGSAAVRAFALYGETTGEIDAFGLPVRYNWAAEYRGKAMVVYGHTPVPEAVWLGKTIDIDTGCVFGGKLTALRYPENELVSVPAREVYCEPAKPLHLPEESPLPGPDDDVLDIAEVLGKRLIKTRLRGNVTIEEENAIAALEVMSRWAVNPKWLIYLPPTMSPCATSELPDFLEHPKQALDYYHRRGVTELVCEKKHMGSRAVLVVCRDEQVAQARFGVAGEGIGVIYTRTGRAFFEDKSLEQAFLLRLRNSLESSNFWEEQETDWVCLDAELMPWSAKAQALLQSQYAAVGAAATGALPAVEAALAATVSRGIEAATEALAGITRRKQAAAQFVEAYRAYCWPVAGLEDYRLAPFHVLATEGRVHIDKTHDWHMETIARFCAADPEWLMATEYLKVDLKAEGAFTEVEKWWLDLTSCGGEGMVVKPLEFAVFRKEGLLQPAVKCRGKEYLRIIYGPDYDLPENLERLKQRGLSRKQSLALREFALGIEGLERFVQRASLRHMHECVFGVLALESEEVDPRL